MLRFSSYSMINCIRSWKLLKVSNILVTCFVSAANTMSHNDNKTVNLVRCNIFSVFFSRACNTMSAMMGDNGEHWHLKAEDVLMYY